MSEIPDNLYERFEKMTKEQQAEKAKEYMNMNGVFSREPDEIFDKLTKMLLRSIRQGQGQIRPVARMKERRVPPRKTILDRAIRDDSFP